MNSESTIDPATASPAGGAFPRISVAKYAIFYALVTGAIAVCIFGSPPAKVSAAGVDMRLPEQVLGFRGKDQAISESERVLLPADTEIVKKAYTGASGENVNFQIVLSGVDRRSIHRPEICLTGQGWRVRSGAVVSVKLKSGVALPIMVLDISRPLGPNKESGELSALYAYWFVSADAETPYHVERIARTSLDLLLHNKAHRWAYVIAMAPILEALTPNGKNRAETLALLEDFIREAVPSFQHSEIARASAGTATTASTGAPLTR